MKRTKPTSTVTTVHFSVDPAGLTSLVRDIWAEGNYEKCFKILSSVRYGEPLPQDVQFDIIRGRKRFALYRNRKDELCIRKDNWKPKGFSQYSDPEDLPKAEPVADPKFVMPKRYAGYESLEEMNMALLIQRSIPTVEDIAEAHESRDQREAAGKPQPDRELNATMGWLMPTGNYYACLTRMEHIWLAGQFDLTEEGAARAGWIKISVGLMNETMIHKGHVEPTQKQLNTLFDWCEKHNKPLPEWAGGNA